MNGTELFHEDGKTAGVFYCEKCKVVKRTKDEADKCCEPAMCQVCGKEIARKHWLTCDSCADKAVVQNEAKRFEAARKVTEWDGWVFLKGTGRDGFSESIEDFVEMWECDHDEGDEKPKYVWACKPDHFATVDLDDILSNISDNAYEDFDSDTLDGLEELKAAIAVFNEANKDVVSYGVDYKIAVLLGG